METSAFCSVSCNGEGHACGLVLQPLGYKLDQPRFFKLQIPPRHGFSRARRQFFAKNVANVALDKGIEIWELREVPYVLRMPSGGPSQTECSTSWRSRPRSEAVSPASAASQSCAPSRAVANALKGHCDCAVRTLDPPVAWPAGKGTQLRSSKETVIGSGRAGAESSAGKSGGPTG